MTTFVQSTPLRTWSNGRHPVRCVGIIEETHDVRTFSFKAEAPTLFGFKPGQFVTLELAIGGEQVMRSYTLSSSPAQPYCFSLTIKRVPGGLVSNWLHDHLAPGDLLVVHGPMGQFNACDFPADKVLLLSGGVGITPVMSMARWFFETFASVDVVFVHSARTPQDIVYHAELRRMAARSEAFRLHLVCERDGKGEPWSGYRGYFCRSMLELMAPDFLQREVFCCGPAPYMAAVRQMLEDAGFDRARYHEEAFVAPLAPVAAQAGEGHRVSFSRSGHSVHVAPGETLHAAAGRAGLHIPKACGMGVCGTCRVLKLSGEVTLAHNGGISDEELAEGYVLTCCGTPQGDVSLDCWAPRRFVATLGRFRHSAWPGTPTMSTKKLPPLSAVVAFDAVVRLGTFTRAASELHLTQSAISKQIKRLEQSLGTPLFERRGNEVILTDSGAVLYRAVTQSLHCIKEAVQQIDSARVPSLSISASAGMASYLVIPLVSRFRRLHPQIDVRVVGAEDRLKLDFSESDFTILYGDGQWQDLRVLRLAEEEIFAVCTPEYRDALQVRGLEDLGRCDLIEMESSDPATLSTRQWMRRMGFAGEHRGSIIRVSSYELAIKAALAGDGVALVWAEAAPDELRSGRLCRVGDESLKTGLGEYIAYPASRELTLVARTLWDWVGASIRDPEGAV